MPRIDAPSVFGRILDWTKGGYWQIVPADLASCRIERRYIDHSLVLETSFTSDEGRVRVIDGFTMRSGGRRAPYCQILRMIEGVTGAMEFDVVFAPRFAYGRNRPWLRRHSERLHSAVGGDGGLLLSSEVDFEIHDNDRLQGRVLVHANDRLRLSLNFLAPHHLYPGTPRRIANDEIESRLEETLGWWRRWAAKVEAALPAHVPAPERLVRSATVLKGLTYAPTGAIAAAATTSLPEAIGGERNWDYRYSWVRDASYAMRSLSLLGCTSETDAFRNFMERTTAGGANDMSIMYGVGGEYLYAEILLDWLDGYRGSKPVRIGNGAHSQLQLDVFGEVLDVAWQSLERGHEPDDAYWSFLCSVVECARRAYSTVDSGVWELRDHLGHFVHSKVMCWVALDRAVRIAKRTGRDAPIHEWTRVRDTIRREVETLGYDSELGTFVQAYGRKTLDAALLQLPRVGFLDHRDERMIRTTEAIRKELNRGGFILRYDAPDGFPSGEGVFLACTFWLVKVLARQGKQRDAEELFERVAGTANDLGLFSEEFDPESGTMLGNFPQAFTHYAHINSALALVGM
jgi:GH15 family glucan-1,4-alpha-glucosidase